MLIGKKRTSLETLRWKEGKEELERLRQCFLSNDKTTSRYWTWMGFEHLIGRYEILKYHNDNQSIRKRQKTKKIQKTIQNGIVLETLRLN